MKHLSATLPKIFASLIEPAKLQSELDFSIINSRFFSNVHPLYSLNKEDLTFLPIDSFENTSIKLFANAADNVRHVGKPAVVDEKQFHKNFDGMRKRKIERKKKKEKARERERKKKKKEKKTDRTVKTKHLSFFFPFESFHSQPIEILKLEQRRSLRRLYYGLCSTD